MRTEPEPAHCVECGGFVCEHVAGAYNAAAIELRKLKEQSDYAGAAVKALKQIAQMGGASPESRHARLVLDVLHRGRSD